ncbi:cholecystokinin receptor type A-like [Rhodnius prolixus]|uniref:Sulfakinin receptor 2 n=1 Tax=Rhodnius prolixus TaxID=13249 RepID=A0A5C0F4P1_RHOPR|nr:sulfakinin receptor 2 [Rhodnius prolixus]
MRNNTEATVQPKSTSTTNTGGSDNGSGISELMIPLYMLIFILAVVGNSLVLATLTRNRRMRTVTNVYLFNLAVADILLGVFCMPFTLIGQLLRNFVFGRIMCKLIPYFQAVSVSVAVWTLVAISLERYFAICRPLKSRRWQTQFHAYKMIAIVWAMSLVWNSPILFVSRLLAMGGKGRHKCREVWPGRRSEGAYIIFLDIVLLMIPLLIMSLAYSLIVLKLWKGLQRELKHSNSCLQTVDRSASLPTMTEVVISKNLNTNSEAIHRVIPADSQQGQFCNKNPVQMWLLKVKLEEGIAQRSGTPLEPLESPGPKFTRHAIRSNYMDKSIEAKKKVIRMLFVVVAEFFICWAPLHVLNTWYQFRPDLVHQYVGSTGVSLVQLLAYISSCCNPITYCFMNYRFRQAFISLFNFPRLCCWCGIPVESKLAQRTDTANEPNSLSANDSTLYAGRANRSEVMVLEKEERV